MQSRWVVSLSDGSSATEGRGEFKNIKDEPSAWQKLLSHLQENNLKITALRLEVLGRRYHLPSLNTAKHKFLSKVPKEIYYRRKVTNDVFVTDLNLIKKDNYERFIGAIADYGDFLVKLWVNEETGDSYLQIEE